MIELKNDHGVVERYYGWDEPGGFRIEGARKDEYGSTKPTCMALILNPYGLFSSISHSIPDGILQGACKAYGGRYQLIRFGYLCRSHLAEYLDLLHKNPFLALGLALYPDSSVAVRMVNRRPQDITRFLGLPEGTWKLGLKFTPSPITPKTLRILPMIPRRRLRMMFHLGCINDGVIECATDLPDEAMSYDVLCYASKMSWSQNPLQKIIELRCLMGLPIFPWRKAIRHMNGAELERIIMDHRIRAREAGLIKSDFPVPSIQHGSYHLVRNLLELKELAERFKNCARRLFVSLEEGHVALMWDEFPEPHVVVLRRRGEQWGVSEVRGIHNRRVSDRVIRHLKEQTGLQGFAW